MTHMFTQWGQYIIHDIVHTPVILAEDKSDLDCNCENPHPECVNIPIPKDDHQFLQEIVQNFFLILLLELSYFLLSKMPS